MIQEAISFNFSFTTLINWRRLWQAVFFLTKTPDDIVDEEEKLHSRYLTLRIYLCSHIRLERNCSPVPRGRCCYERCLEVISREAIYESIYCMGERNRLIIVDVAREVILMLHISPREVQSSSFYGIFCYLNKNLQKKFFFFSSFINWIDGCSSFGCGFFLLLAFMLTDFLLLLFLTPSDVDGECKNHFSSLTEAPHEDFRFFYWKFCKLFFLVNL